MPVEGQTGRVVNKGGRPPKNKSRAVTNGRPTRIPIRDAHRDVLKVDGLDEATYHHRWVYDEDETGHRILQFIQAGYDFVPAEDLTLGNNQNYKSEAYGNIVRVSSGARGFLYLMRISKSLYKADQKAAQQEITDMERRMIPDYASEPDNYVKENTGISRTRPASF